MNAPVTVANSISPEAFAKLLGERDALIERLTAMAKANERKLSLKVSEKGAVSLYGMGRFPVTLYGTQWERLLDHANEVRAFLKVNANLLSVKA